MSESAFVSLVSLVLTALLATYAHKRYGKWWLTILNVFVGFVVIQVVVALLVGLVVVMA